ncbi:hypothetical protein RND81_12G177700 [Saponaria officinalis]|uniref:DNA-directed RNA polymerase III subunit n=1 Tax=Saponaria officinalis TaxID=3572 RepID=A0AAW1HC46_SAPOF
MGSRGGGRGRGRGGGGFRHAKQEPFVLFPDIELPAIDKDKIKGSTELVKLRLKLHGELKDLPYFLEETLTNDEDSVGIERYSDKTKKRSGTHRVTLENSGYMTLKPGFFPLELVQGAKRRTGRKVQWNPTRDFKKLDKLAELEDKFKDEDTKKEKDGDEEDEEEDPEDELEQEDDYEIDDYNGGETFDDDEDDYNMPDDDDGEDIL